MSKRNSSVSCDLLFKEEQKSWSTTTPEVDDLQHALRGAFVFLSLFAISPSPCHDGALHRRGLVKGRCSLDNLSCVRVSDFVCSVKFHVPFSYLSVPVFVFDVCSFGCA